MIRFVLKCLTGCWLSLWLSVITLVICCVWDEIFYTRLSFEVFQIYCRNSKVVPCYLYLLTIYIFFWMEVLCIWNVSLVIMHAFIQEIINKTYSGVVLIFCCYNWARLTWGHLYTHSFTGNKSNMLPERNPGKISNGRPDLGNDCKSLFFKKQLLKCVIV